MSKIDLHLHSLYSDGRQTVAEVLELAKNNGIEVVSLTDHDSTLSLEEARQEAARLGLKFIPGIEVTTIFEDRRLHILAYNIDPQNKALQSALDKLLESRKEGVLEKIKLVPGFDLDDFVTSQKNFFNRWKAADYLVAKSLAKDKTQALEYLRGVHVGSADITTKVAIELIHGAGGIAVLAHPFGPKISLKTLRRDSAEQHAIIRTLQAYGLDGLECYQPSHSEQDTQAALKIAQELDLLITGGTDWHGPLAMTGEGIKQYIPNYVNHPGDLSVPEDVQENLMRCLLFK